MPPLIKPNWSALSIKHFAALSLTERVMRYSFMRIFANNSCEGRAAPSYLFISLEYRGGCAKLESSSSRVDSPVGYNSFLLISVSWTELPWKVVINPNCFAAPILAVNDFVVTLVRLYFLASS